MKALIVEDDKNIADIVKTNIQGKFDVTIAYDGEEGLFYAMDEVYDIIVLDIMMPKMNGYEVLSGLREKNIKTPVLLLTAKNGIDDKINGFTRGADDYLTKPFHREELILRIDAIIKRSKNLEDVAMISFNEIHLTLESKLAKIRDEIIDLPGKQFEILEYFILNKDIILTKDQIFNRIWGFQSNTTTNVVEVYTSALRKVLKEHGLDYYIRTVRGVGYIFSDQNKEQ